MKGSLLSCNMIYKENVMTFGKTIKLRKAQHQVLNLVDDNGGEVSEEGDEEAKDSVSTCRRWRLS